MENIMISCRSVFVMTAVCLVVEAAATPVRRSPDLEARRRSAIDRSMIRFGRSYPPEPSAADLREVFESPSRRGNSFLRFGRSQPITLSTDDLATILKAYEDEYEAPSKKSASFVRFGRNPSFVRFGRSADDEKSSEQSDILLVPSYYPQRKNRARDHFIRFGRDSEELNEDVEEESRRKRATEPCKDCKS